jgi:hypothetical protein
MTCSATPKPIMTTAQDSTPNKEASGAHAGWPRAKSAIMVAKEVFAA